MAGRRALARPAWVPPATWAFALLVFMEAVFCGLYLLRAVGGGSLVAALPGPWGLLDGGILALALSAFLAILSYLLVEKPALRLGHQNRTFQSIAQKVKRACFG